MIIQVLLLSGALIGGSKFYEKFFKPDSSKSDSAGLGTPLVSNPEKQQQEEPSKTPIKIDNKSINEKFEESDVIRKNFLSDAEIDKQLTVTSVATVLTGVGTLFFPPLIPLGIVGILYSFKDTAKRAYVSLSEDRKLTFDSVETILTPGLFFSGYYFTCCLSSSLYMLSMKLLSRVEDKTRQNVINFFENHPRSVWIMKGKIEIEIPFDALQTGDIVSVKAGETIPADGIITEGVASIDQHILTGESMPLEKSTGDPVFASTVVLSGRVVFRVEKSGKETVVANIANILNRTVDYKTCVQSKGDKIAERSILPTMALSAAAFPVAGSIGSLAVLSSYIGADVRIMVPLSTLNFLKAASENGILIKDGRALELLNKVDTVVFDKTGTLTMEQLFVEKIHTCDGFEEMEILEYAAMAENRQTHPVAKAILEKADECRILPASIKNSNPDDTCYEVGYGIRVKNSDTLVRVGSLRFMQMEDVEISDTINEIVEGSLERGNSLVMVAKDNIIAGVIELHATVRPEVKNIISSLKMRKKALYMITGDNKNSAKVLAEELGIDNYFAETFPEQKARIIEQLQKDGRSVCFIGDGINDSIAMKMAHVSVSLSGASTVATDTANIIFMDGTLRSLDKIFELAKDFDKNINNALKLTIIPGIINIGGVFLLHSGIYVAMGLYYIFMPLGVGNSFLPMIKYKKKDDRYKAGSV